MKRLLAFALLAAALAIGTGAQFPFSFWKTAGASIASLSSAAISANGDALALTFTSAGTTVTGFTAATNGSAPFTTVTLGSGSWAGSVLTLPITNRNVLSSASETLTVTGPGATDYTAFSGHAVTNNSTVAAIDSITGTYAAGSPNMGAVPTYTFVGQIYTAAATKTVRMAVFPLYKAGSPTGTITAAIYNQSAPSPPKPPGSTQQGTASAAVNVSAVSSTDSASPTLVLFTGMSASTTSGTGYTVVGYASGAANDFTNYIKWDCLNGGNTDYYSTAGAVWAAYSEYTSTQFRLYGN